MTVPPERKSPRPLLPAGFHHADLNGLRRLCVDYFPASVTRPRLLATLTQVVSVITRSTIPGNLWVGGSFLAEVPNPEDMDVAFVLTEPAYRELTPDQLEFFNWFGSATLFEKHGCNNYALVVDRHRGDGELLMRYWLRQYRHSHDYDGSCVIEVSVPALARHDAAA